MKEEIILAVVAAGIGWLFGVLSSAGRRLIQERRLRTALVDEVVELSQGSAVRVWMALARSLQIYAHEGVNPAIPLPLKNEVYKRWYGEAMLVLNKYQRAPLELLHQQVESVNSSLERLEDLVRTITEKHATKEDTTAEVARYGSLLKAIMYNVADVQWHAKHFIDHPLMPELRPMSPAHKSYVKFQEKVRTEVENIQVIGKGIPREKFDEIYQADVFDSIPDQ